MTIKSHTPNSTAFAVAEVQPATEPVPQTSYKEAIDKLLDAQSLSKKGKDACPIEACARYRGHLVANVRYHPLVAGLQFAYAEHRPVSLSPDMIWLLICQGVAHHINANAEALRPKLVQHPGQLGIHLRRDDFHKGSPENPWPEVFGEFSAQIRTHIGPMHDLFVPAFSTTGPVERAASEIVLLDSMQKYFTYKLGRVICGIPTITLEGTPADWRSIVERLHGFMALDLEWWLTPLRPILQQFLDAANGEVDLRFWRSIYRVYQPDQPCSPASALGWIHLFFPYLADHQGVPSRRNPWLAGERDLEELVGIPKAQTSRFRWWGGGRAEDRHPGYVHESAFPSGLASAPFAWEYLDPTGNVVRQWKMEFLGGFVGVAQERSTLCLRPEIGWAVRGSKTTPND